jgi:hypothetical protein
MAVAAVAATADSCEDDAAEETAAVPHAGETSGLRVKAGALADAAVAGVVSAVGRLVGEAAEIAAVAVEFVAAVEGGVDTARVADATCEVVRVEAWAWCLADIDEAAAAGPVHVYSHATDGSCWL